jgi:PAS domain S-box-containing protein
MGKTAFEIGWISEEQRARMLQTIRERGRVSGMELSLRRKDSGEVICLYNGEIITVGGTQRLLSIAQDITELKRTDEALRESEDRFRSIFENAIDGIMIADAGTRTNIEVNKAMCRMLGYTRDEIIGRGIADLHPKKDMPDVLKTFERQLCGETSLAEDIPMLRKDGTIFYADINAAAVTVGGKQCMIGIFRDISERKRAEEEKDRLAQAVSIVTEGIAITDEEDRFIYLNDAHAKMYGYTQSELVGKTWRDVTPRELVPSIERELSRALHSRKNGVWSGEAPGLCKDGTEIATEITATARWDEKGDYLGHICVVRDIAERKRAEGELREKEQKYRLLFESANDGIFLYDETGFTDCNQRGAEMYGLPKAGIIGRSPAEFAPERQPNGRLSAEVAGEKVRAALNGVPQMFEWQPLHADGSTFDVEITLNRLELGGKVCLQAIVRDISERKRLEQEHLKSEKLQSIGTLAGGIAHDFNNLLQGVFGYISMAKLTHDQKEKSLSMLEQAEKALHRSVSLTSQLLTFSKGGKPLKKVIDPKPLIENAVKFALSGSRVDYELSFDDDLLPVEADEGQLGQVVQNIVLNAEQAMPLGGRIEIAARNVLASSLAGVLAASSGDLVEITIRDQGIGIPPEHLPKIFDPYFTTKEKGSGLGLATTYSIIKNHGGDINVASVLGKGTTFTVYFPAARQEGEGAASPADPRIERKGRVLVMDDEELVRRVAYELLTGLGHGVELAVHGGEAVEKYRQAKSAGRPFDVVILDLTIRGGMGGEEAMRKLLEIDPGVKAIVSSGYSNDSVVANYRNYGFAAFLKKPYDLTDLQSTLNTLLGE